MNKKLKVLNAALLISSVGVLSAMEDAATKEARKGALADTYTAEQHHIEVDQHHLAAIAVQPHHALLAGTDTDLVIKGIRAGNMEEYFWHVKMQVMLKIDAFVDSLMPYGGGNFLNGEVMVGGGYPRPAARTRDAFKAALDLCINTTNIATAVPANAQLSSLARFQDAVHAEIIQALDTYLGGLLPNGVQLLSDDVMVGGHNQPDDRTRGAFTHSLIMAIFD